MWPCCMHARMHVCMCVCVSDRAERREPDETDQLVPAVEAQILQTEREDPVLRSDFKGEWRRRWSASRSDGLLRPRYQRTPAAPLVA